MDDRFDPDRWKIQVDAFRATDQQLYSDLVMAVSAVETEYAGGGFGDRWIARADAEDVAVGSFDQMTLRRVLIFGSLLRLAQNRADSLLIKWELDLLPGKIAEAEDETKKEALIRRKSEIPGILEEMKKQSNSLRSRIDRYRTDS